MFTQTSKKPALVFATLCTVGFLGALMVYGLNTFSSWAERDLGAHPFMQEDWLRYLLPEKFVQKNKSKILLTGPSTVRENLLYERFEEEFPDQVIIQGGISAGTLDDVTASLHYISKAYGNAALPTILVLGISPRFIANFPEKRPFKGGIDRYSPYFSAKKSGNGLELVPKNFVESLASRARFLVYKQPERYRTAIFALVNHLMAGDRPSPADWYGKTARQKKLDRLFDYPPIRKLASNMVNKRALDHDFTEVIAWLASPYKYRLDLPADISGLISWMNGKDTWWQDVHAWNPREDEQATRARLERFNSFITAHDIDLFVVNMPERDASRVRYKNENYAAYLEIVRNTLPNAHFMDMREFLGTAEFHDLEHSTYAGSLRLTNEIISHVKSFYRPGQ